MHWSALPADALSVLRTGGVIPAHPLALDDARRLDAVRQRALTRYYLDAGAAGLAVGVHATQFAIREAGLYQDVLFLAAETADGWCERPKVMIAGLAGRTGQARREAGIARALGYHAGLLSLAAFPDASDDELVEHCAAVAEEIPLVGFYLQKAVGGRDLSAAFWRRFAAIDNAIAVKVAPFDRYRTIDVVRGLAEAGAEERVTLYTGNDDHILLDLLTPFRIRRGDGEVVVRIRGGLLGQWSVWTARAVELLEKARAAVAADAIPLDLLALDAEITDANGAIFDVANDFFGCIAGCHEILRRQGLLENRVLLDPEEGLGPGQAAEIDRVSAAYPHLADDAFVAANLDRWLA